jgi:hypothetical protein
LKSFGQKYGFTFEKITFGIDKKRNLPSGNAVVVVRKGKRIETDEMIIEDKINEEIEECIKTLQGESCGGRPVRVSRIDQSGGSMKNQHGVKDANRYFGGDISSKCNLCGEVGHKQFECMNEPLAMPCHLCAGQDHDAGRLYIFIN